MTIWLLGAAGCDACSRKKTVPFKRLTKDASTASPDARSIPAPLPADQPSPASASYPERTRRISVGGLPLDRDSGAFRASLGADLDRDGEMDALLLSTDEAGALWLERASGADGALSAPLALTQVQAAQPACTPSSITLRPLGARYAHAQVERRCDVSADLASSGPSGEGAEDAQGPTTTHLILSMELASRVLERVTLQPAAARAQGGALELSF